MSRQPTLDRARRVKIELAKGRTRAAVAEELGITERSVYNLQKMHVETDADLILSTVLTQLDEIRLLLEDYTAAKRQPEVETTLAS